MPTPTAAPTPTTSSCPSNVTGEYAGNAFNDTFALRSDIRVQMEQSGCQIQGYYTVFPPLEGSGPFSGLVDGGKVNFTLRSNISGYYMEAKFDGAIGDAGGLNGTYVVPPWAGYPDTQVGRWDLTPVVETQN